MGAGNREGMTMTLGEQLKESGQARVLAHQEPTWCEDVERCILWMAQSEDFPVFTLDDIRECFPATCQEPTHPNAWGALFTHLAKTKRIVCVGYRPSTRPSRHAGIVRVWRRA